MTNTLTFTCTICGEPSTAICAYCTKDSCANHLCERCGRCSDCCECEIRLETHMEEARNGAPAGATAPAAASAGIEPEPPVTEDQLEETPDESSEPAVAEPPEPAPELHSGETPAAMPDPTEPPDGREHQE